MRYLFACIAALTAACTDPAIHVQFSIPARYTGDTVSVRLRIVEPPTAEPFTCDDIAYARVPADVLRLSTVVEVTTPKNETAPLADLDRLSQKLLLADGLDDDGQPLASGCVEVNEIDGVLDARIEGQALAVVTSPARTATSTPGGLTDPVVFEVRDRRGQTLADVEGLWQVTGAGGDGEGGMAMSDGDGRLTVQPRAPAQAGPFFLSLSVRWGVGPRAIVPGAATPSREVETIDGRALAYRSGRIGPNGEPGLAVLVATGPAATELVFVYREGGAYVQRKSPALGNVRLIGILEELRDPPTSGRDRVIALDANDWIEVTPEGMVTRQPLMAPGLGFGNPTAIVSATECRVGAPARLMIGFDDGFVGVYGATGVPVSGHFIYRFPVTVFPLDPLASGCLDIEGSGPIRTYVLSPGSLPLYVITERNLADIVVGGLIALSSGVGFVPPSKANVGLLLGTQINGNDLVLSRARGRVTGTGDSEALELVPEGTDPVPNAFSVLGTAAGDLDADGRLDVVSLFGASSDGIALDTFQVWSYLALEVDGRRIAGPLVGSLPALSAPHLLLIDIDRDTVPDVIVGDRPGPGATTTRLEIYRLGV